MRKSRPGSFVACPLWVIRGHWRRKMSCPVCLREQTFALGHVCLANSEHRTASVIKNNHILNRGLRRHRFRSAQLGTPLISVLGAATAPLAAEQRRKIGNCLHHCGRLEAEFFGNLGGAALNPERVQPGRRGAIDVPGIRRDEAKLGVGDLESFGGQIVDSWADLKNLNFLDADNIIEKIADSCTLSRSLQHFWLAVRQNSELNSLLL